MSLTPALAIHLAAALPSLAIGIAVVTRRKGTHVHRLFGRAWAVLMAVTALSSFWIQSSGHFSYIHAISLIMLIVLARAVYAIRQGNVRAHRASMMGAFAGLVIAGAFAMTPGRLIGHLLFG
jgi:uncharacterized membrane protein